MYGTVILKPTKAELSRDRDAFGKMDPYCKIKANSGEFKTHTANDQGKTPFWNDSFQIQLTGDATIHISIWDKDTFSKDDFLAETTINLMGALNVGQNANWHPLYRKGVSAGRIFIEMQYIQGGQQGFGMQQQGFGMQQQGFGMPPQGPGFGFPPQQGQGFGFPPQGGQGFGYPPQGMGLYPPQGGQGFGYPPQGGQGFGYPPQGGQGFGYPPQGGHGCGPY